jgi:hypothetical protein
MTTERGTNTKTSSDVVDAHDALLRRARRGAADVPPRELLGELSHAWRDDSSAWPLVAHLVSYAQERVYEASPARRNGSFDDREWLREQRVLGLVVELYDDIRRAVLARRRPRSGVYAPDGKAHR